MTEQAGPKPYKELPLTPEDYANLVEIVSWVNDVSAQNYPDITPLTVEQIKIVPSVAEVEHSRSEAAVHTLFQRKVGDKVRFAPVNPASWVSTQDNAIFFSGDNIRDMRRSRVVGYFGIGLDTINAAVELGAKPVRVDSEKAQQMARDMVTASYREVLHDLVDEADLQEALAYMDERGSAIEVRGLALSVIVENKRFLPATGVIQNSLLLTYLARPIRSDFALKIGREFHLPSAQRYNFQTYAQGMQSLEGGLIKNPSQHEMKLVASMGSMGYRGRNTLLKAYQEGELGIKIIETHQQNP